MKQSKTLHSHISKHIFFYIIHLLSLFFNKGTSQLDLLVKKKQQQQEKKITKTSRPSEKVIQYSHSIQLREIQ